MNKQQQTELEAAAFRRLLAHLDQRKDVQNIDLMTQAGFCRNCLAKWFKADASEHNLEVSYDEAREHIYGMPYSQWKEHHQKDSSPEQQQRFQQRQALYELIDKLNAREAEFEDTMALIGDFYNYQATDFTNGSTVNASGTNEGSCKIFALAQINDLTPTQTLPLFGRFYFDDVLGHPDAQDHGNIRNFMSQGWKGISFKATALTLKAIS
jgi:hypothetical protein